MVIQARFGVSSFVSLRTLRANAHLESNITSLGTSYIAPLKCSKFYIKLHNLLRSYPNCEFRVGVFKDHCLSQIPGKVYIILARFNKFMDRTGLLSEGKNVHA